MFDYFKWQLKKHLFDFIFLILIILLINSVALLFWTSTKVEEPTKGICIGLATGLLSSGLISLYFYARDKYNDKLEKNMLYDKYISQIKAYVFFSLDLFNFAKLDDGTYSFHDYLKEQHRWFHEYYKRIIANNYNKKDVDLRKKQINDYIINTYSKFIYFIKDDYKMVSCGLNDYNYDELRNLIFNYMFCYDDINKNSFNLNFLYFSSYIDELSNLTNSFKELKCFDKINYVVHKGKINVVKDEFYKLEKDFKFLDDFSSIRNKNIKKYYKK